MTDTIDAVQPAQRPAAAMPELLRADRILLAVTAALSFALSLVVQLVLLPLRSGNLDEAVYIYQAEMLREGMLTLPAERYGDFFRPWLSGELDGRIFTEYQFGLPLFLAISDTLLGSMRIGLAVVAALTPVLSYLFVRRLFAHRRSARWAAVLVALSPMTVLQSGMFVTYALTVLLLLVVGAAALRAADLVSWPAALGAGLATGAALLVRPLDALLFALPLALLALVRLRRIGQLRFDTAGRLAGAALGGIVPFGLMTLWYNNGTTGHPLRFPNMAADELNTFGFGVRRLVESEPTIDYQVADALDALWANVSAVPSWLPGGVLALVLATMGALIARPPRWMPASTDDASGVDLDVADDVSQPAEGRLAEGRLAERLSLVAIALAFPIAYVFWWATKLSAPGALNGIGPHYYVPTLTVVCLLAARGLATCVPRGAPTVISAVALVAATAWSLPDKIEDQRWVTGVHRSIAAALPEDLDGALVVVDYNGRPYVMSQFPFLTNSPRLDDDVLFAADRGPLNAELSERFPDRDLYFLRRELRPEDELFDSGGVLTPLSFTTGPSIELSIAPGPELAAEAARGGNRFARAFATVGGRTTYGEAVRLSSGDGPDRSGDAAASAVRTTWTLEPAGPDGEDAGVHDTSTLVLDRSTDVLVGIQLSATADFDELAWVGASYSVALGGDELTVMEPGRGFRFIRFPANEVRLDATVSPFVEIEVAARP